MTVTWYPTVYPDRCDGCRELDRPKCIEFCPHNVFTIADNKAIVANPQNCIEGCIACMPVCPTKAIEFPLHQGFRKTEKSWSKGLKKAVCKKCGKSFWTNEDREVCWECADLK